MPFARAPFAARYGAAIALAVVAFGLTLALGRLLEHAPLALFFGAVALAAWYGGFGPGILAASVAIALMGSSLAASQRAFELTTAGGVVSLLGFAAVAWIVSLMAGRLRRAREDADDARRRFAVILDGAADGITAHDPSGHLVFANEAAAHSSGYASAEVMLAAPPGDFVNHFELLDRQGGPFPIDRLPGRLAAQGEPAPETMIRYRNRATNEERWSLVRARAVRDRDGRVSLVINIFRDATQLVEQQQQLEQQGAELEQQLEESQSLAQELEQSNEQLGEAMADIEAARAEAEAARRVAERSADRAARLQEVTAALSGATDVEGVTAAILDQGLAALGASAGVVALLDESGNTLEIVREVGYVPGALEKHDHARLDVRTPLTDVIRTGTPVHIASLAEYRERYPDVAEELSMATGTQALAALPLLVSGRTIGAMKIAFRHSHRFAIEESGFVLALAQQCAQAIDRARLYDRERRSRAEAEAANRVKSDFLAAMSHELRTPLNAIAGYADLLELGIYGPLGSEQQEALARIRRSQHNLLALVNNVLNFAKLEAGELEMRVDDVPVVALMEGLEMLLAPQVRAKRIAYRCEPCDPALLARADREKVEQILLNLLSNAVKFTPHDGRITVSAEAEDSTVRITVRDTGMGIPTDKLAAVFEPFVQLDRSLTHLRDGSGLGLAISRNLARRMDGDIEVESEVGRGSAFTLTLPRAVEARIATGVTRTSV
jgi:PAS domain S-box-containing protein